ncbi:MAG: hypothetical protein PUJ84_06515 [Mollicutes bacterium]|nr:hypothetical protein [Mollicutes bacterium]
MNDLFINAVPVFDSSLANEKNIFLLFPLDFKKADKLVIAGENEYQIYLNGKLIGYGPSRAALNHHRVDTYHLSNLEENNRLLIVLASFNTKSFECVDEPAFIQFELFDEGKIVTYSNLESPCYLYEGKYQKVSRFSFQRPFVEAYNPKYDQDIFSYGHDISYSKRKLDINRYGYLTNRTSSYPKLDCVKFSLIEKNEVSFDENKPIHDDRYYHNDFLCIYHREEWDVDYGKIISRLVIGNTLKLDNVLKDNESITYKYSFSVTGFTSLSIKVKVKAKLFIYFEEISVSKDKIELNCFRNTTDNYISYELNPGEYNLTSLAPYTLQYLRVVVISGIVEVNDVGVILLENPDSYRLRYKLDDKKIETILKAARNTFASNAVDVLTDCPSRERAGWLCDSFYTGRAETIFTGFNLVERNFLENYANFVDVNELPEGMIPMCYPSSSSEKNFIPNWAMFYGIELEEYFRKNDDPALFEKSLIQLSGVVDYFAKFENEFGLLENLDGWIFVEWSEANNPLSTCGVNLPTNMLYAGFLSSASHLLKDPGLEEKSEKIKRFIREKGFNGTFFVDNLIRDETNKLIKNNRISETTQYYAFYFKTATVKEYSNLFNLLLNEFGPSRDDKKIYPDIFKSNVLIGDYFRMEILMEEGEYSKVYEESIDFYYSMAIETLTLWEKDSKTDSLNHGFTSYIANVVISLLTGIKDIDYKNKVISIADNGYSKDYDIYIPLRDEYLHIIQKDNKKEIELPEGYILIEK